jgi:hypothetical protein
MNGFPKSPVRLEHASTLTIEKGIFTITASNNRDVKRPSNP